MKVLYSRIFFVPVLLMAFQLSTSAQVVINEVYGGGGNSGADYRNDFIELYNNGNSAVSLAGWSVQYASAAGTSWAVTALSGSIPAKGYYLIQQAAGTGGTISLPSPDATGTTAMSATAGKVALVNSSTALSGACPTGASIIDFVGFGTTANCYEGTGPTPAPSNTQSVQRVITGADNNNNATDFEAKPSTPQNTATAPNSVSVTGVSDAAEPGTDGSFSISFSPATSTSTMVNFAFSGAATYGIDYNVSFSGVTAATAASSGNITVAAGNNLVTVTIIPVDDALVEGPESISLTLSSPTAGYIVGTGSASIDLIDNEVIAIPLTTTPYVQNFNTLATAGIDNALTLQGWSLLETGGGARDNELYAADAGSSTTGDTYSYGASGSSERALGALRSGSLVSSFGAIFTNNTGTVISALKISYTGEQWRLGNAGRTDQLSFQYSLDATDLSVGSWTNVDQLAFTTPTTATTGAKDGNAAANRSSLSHTITGLSIPAGASFFIRWTDVDATGADDGLAVDDLTVEANPKDETPPVVVSVSPANGASGVPVNLTYTINYNENIQKGTGNLVLTNTATNAVVANLDVASSSVTISGSSANFNFSNLDINTSYQLTVPLGAFADIAGNLAPVGNFSFTTGITLYSASFDNCTSAITDGFNQFSALGVQTWACTNFGRNAGSADPTASAPYGVQMNGFASGTNVPNIDWLISPSYNLTNTIYPLLSFYSRTAFNGLPLQLKVSTDYISGDPTLATWTDLNGKFPNQGSDAWTLSSGINLSAFKTGNVHIAFVYESSDDEGARWTLDDIRLDNSPAPPPPTLSLSTTDIRFGYVAAGGSADKTISFIANDLVEPVSLMTTGNFTISKDGISFSNAISYAIAEANNVSQTVYIRFSPAANGQDYTGNLTVSTTGISSLVSLAGTSIDPATTLEVVNWNIEWFGSPVNGPTNDNLQQQNVIKILSSVGADVYAFEEIVSESRLADVVSALPGYAYTISNYGSHTNPYETSPGSLADAQKLAFVYKTSVLSNVSVQPLLTNGVNTAEDLTNPAFDYWASGRYPYMMTADVTLNCVTKTVRFVLVHAKANTSPTAASYERRRKGADTLYTVLQAQFPNDNIIILGDFNDDFDQSITAGFTTPSWNIFNVNSSDFNVATLPLSLAGKKSTVSYNDMIDHVVISNDIAPYYMNSSATVLSDITSLVGSYGTTTSDHYPIFTRYRFENPAIKPTITCPGDTAFCINNTGSYHVFTVSAAAGCTGSSLTLNYVVTGATSRSGTGNNASGAFSAGTSYIVWTATDEYGNQSSCSTKVAINTLPVVTIPDAYALPAGVLPNTVYRGYAPASSLTLTSTVSGGTASYTYLWTGNTTNASKTVAPTTTTTYMVTVTDAAGCTATATKTVAVLDVRAGKKLDKIAVCHNQISLEVEPNDIPDHLGHGDMLAACAVNPAMLVKKNVSEAGNPTPFVVNAYPNPSVDHFTLVVFSINKTDRISVRVFDGLGKQVELLNKAAGIQTIRFGSRYVKGLYFAEVLQGDQKAVIKLLKQ